MSIDNPTDIARAERQSAAAFEVKAYGADLEARAAERKGNDSDRIAKESLAAEYRACAELARRQATWLEAAA